MQQLCWESDFITVSFACVHTYIRVYVCVSTCLYVYICRPFIWADTVDSYSSAFSLAKVSSLCLLCASPSSRNSVPMSVYQSRAVPSKFLSKTTASSTCFSETSAAFCQLVDTSKSEPSAGLVYAAFSIFQFSLKSPLRKSFVLCCVDTSSGLCRLVPLGFLCQHSLLKRMT